MHVLAIDIGGTKTSAGIIEGTDIVEYDSWPSQGDASSVQSSIRDRVSAFRGVESARACGIGFGGQFDFGKQQVIRSVHVSGWEAVHLSEWASRMFGLHTIADNDANVGALGEITAGAGANAKVVVYLTLSTGVGGAIAVDGNVQRGAQSLAAEFGHITLEPEGPQCGCGLRGCAERLLSGQWLERDHGAPPAVLFQDDPFLSQYAELLACLLRQVTMVVDPDCFILGGGIGASSPLLAERVQAALATQLESWSRTTPHVRTAVLGRNSVLIGAAHLAKEWYGSA